MLRSLAPSLARQLEPDSSGTLSFPNSVPQGPVGHEPAAAGPDRRALLENELADLCLTMGFEAASLFVPRTGGRWEVAARTGPERPWHAVFDPSATGPLGPGLVFADTRAMPGIGVRLAALGCGAIAILPVPGGTRVVLDAETVRRGTPSVDHAEEHLDRIGGLAASRRPAETEMPARVTRAVRRAMDDPAADLSHLLEGVREALGAAELYYVMQRDGHIEVVEGRRRSRSDRGGITTPIGPVGALPGDEGLGDAEVARLGTRVGATSATLGAAIAQDDPREVLLAGWPEAPAPASEAMRTVARIVGTARAAIDSRRHAVDALMTRERNRWAYEIHDGLTQAVTTAVLELESLERQIERDPVAARQALAATRAEIRKSLSDVRGVLYELHGDDKAAPPVDEPLTKYVNDVVRRWRLPARVSVSGDLGGVPKHVQGVAYVVIREALANAAKHAAAGAVAVSVVATGTDVTVEVGDTGKGFDQEAGPSGEARRNFGLEMIRKRVAEVGGTISVHSAPGRGTRVVAQLPVREGER
jgi:signal transduction histidine kinase